MNILQKIFGKKQTSALTTEQKTLPSIEEFPQLTPADRMGVIVALGDSGKAPYFPFMKYALLTEKDQHVKFTALKRIHLFKDHPDTIPILTELKNNGEGQQYEPYFSMALSRLGLISIEAFERTTNNS